MSQLPPCPMCGNSKHTVQMEPGLYRCALHGLHDGKPNEGGDYGHFPDQRLMREERATQRKQQRENDNRRRGNSFRF